MILNRIILNRIIIGSLLVLTWISWYFFKYDQYNIYLKLLFIFPFLYEYFSNIFQINRVNSNNYFKLLLIIGIFWLGLFSFFIIKFSKKIILNLMIICSISDILQYFGGKNLRQYYDYKPFPTISPNKTLVGYITGLIFTPLLLFYILDFKFIQLFFITIFGIFGDLFASKIKRIMHIKDYSNLLGAHGGFLDRFDSLAFSVILYPLIK